MEFIDDEKQELIQKAETALTVAKINLMNNIELVFFSTVCMSLEHIITFDVPTAATNGKYIKYNPNFFLECSKSERVGLILHEVLHVVFQHMSRRVEIDKSRYVDWNIAGDYVINYEISKINDPAVQLPAGALLDKNYANMTTEEVFAALPKREPGDIPGGFMNDVEGLPEDASPAEISKLQESIDNTLVQAQIQATQAGQSGSVPGNVRRYLEELMHPVVPWQKTLKRFITKSAKVEYSFRKPNRRFFPKHYLPSQVGEVMCDVAVAMDVSGSVTDHIGGVFLGETRGLINQVKPSKTTFIQFDTSIKEEYVLKNANDIHNVKFVGGGGTNITPVMEWAVQNNPHVLIVFTDGYYTEPAVKPKCPVLWVVYDNPKFKAPFGRHIPFVIPRQ